MSNEGIDNNNHNEEEEKPDYTAEFVILKDNKYPEVSCFFQKYFTMNIIDYNTYHPGCWVNIEDASIDDLPVIQGKPVSSYIEQFVQEFDSVPEQDIFTNVPPVLQAVGAYIINQVPQKMGAPMVTHWEPPICQVAPTVPSLMIFFARILHRLKNPNKFHFFLRAGIFGQLWTAKTCLQNPILMGCTTCTYKGKPGYWAILDREKKFTLYRTGKKGCEIEIEQEIYKTVASPDKTKVTVLDSRHQNLCEFSPTDQATTEFWSIIFSKVKMPFPFFYTNSLEVYPQSYYVAFYHCLTSTDCYLVMSFMKSQIYDLTVWESIVRCFSHAQKLEVLCHAVYSTMFQQGSEPTTMTFFQENHFLLFARAFGRVFWSNYHERFFHKITDLIDSKSNLYSDVDRPDIKVCEKLVFNILNFIMKSDSYIPSEWRLALNILRSYIIVRYNNVATMTLMLSVFFGFGIIYGFFLRPRHFVKGFTMEYFDNLDLLLKMFYVPFTLNIYAGKTRHYAQWNPRLEYNFYPQWYAFLLRISDLPNPITHYSIPSDKLLGYSLNECMKAMINPSFNQISKDLILDTLQAGARSETMPGWLLSITLSRFFLFNFDPQPKVKKQPKISLMLKPVVLPGLPSYSKTGLFIEGRTSIKVKKGKGMIPDVANFDDIVEDEEDYDPFTMKDDGKVKYYLPGSTMELPDTIAETAYWEIPTDSEDPYARPETDKDSTANFRYPRTKLDIQLRGPEITTFKANFNNELNSDDEFGSFIAPKPKKETKKRKSPKHKHKLPEFDESVSDPSIGTETHEFLDTPKEIRTKSNQKN